jgi:hypothetical protein
MTAIRNLASSLLLDVVAMILVIGAGVAALLILLVSTPINFMLERAASKRSTMCRKCFDKSSPETGIGFIFQRNNGKHTCSSCGCDYYVS